MARSPKALHIVLNAILTEYRSQISALEALQAKFVKDNEASAKRISKLDERIESIKEDAFDDDGELINEDIGEAMDWLDNYAVRSIGELLDDDLGIGFDFEGAISHLQERIDELEPILAELPEDCFVLVREDDDEDEEDDEDDDDDDEDGGDDDKEDEGPPAPAKENGGRSSATRHRR